MANYIVRRIIGILPILLILYTLVFVLIHAAPGGPWDSTKPIPADVRANLLRFYHLDDPLFTQYTRYLGNFVLHGDLGPTYRQPNRTVNQVLSFAFSISLQLGLCAIVLALILGMSAGIFAALNMSKPIDYMISVITSIGISVPEYVTTPLLILILALMLHLVPTSGWDGLFSTRSIIPVLALAIRPCASIARYTRSSMLQVLEAPYIITAKAKGLPFGIIVIKHALRNALIPIVTIVSSHTAFIIAGSFYVETAYGIPGFGRTFIGSIADRDYPVVLGATLVVGTVMATINLCTDIFYSFLDPRIKYFDDK